MDILKGYRTYIMGAAIILQQLLQMLEVEVDAVELSDAITMLLGIGVIIFRKLATR